MSTNRFCQSCKNLVGRRWHEETSPDWKCHAPENVVTTSQCLVTGKTLYHLRFDDCFAARSDESGCASIGKWHQEYLEAPPLKVAGGMKMTADSLLEELEKTK